MSHSFLATYDGQAFYPELPVSISPNSKVRLTIENVLPKKKRAFGCGKGIILMMSDDFNAPLDLFKDYRK